MQVNVFEGRGGVPSLLGIRNPENSKVRDIVKKQVKMKCLRNKRKI